VSRRYFECELGDNKFYLQSLNSTEWLKSSASENYLLMAGAMSVIDETGATLYAATENGVQEMLRELLDDDAGLIHQFREMVAEHVFQAGVKKKASPIGSLPGSSSPASSTEPTGEHSSTS